MNDDYRARLSYLAGPSGPETVRASALRPGSFDKMYYNSDRVDSMIGEEQIIDARRGEILPLLNQGVEFDRRARLFLAEKLWLRGSDDRSRNQAAATRFALASTRAAPARRIPVQ